MITFFSNKPYVFPCEVAEIPQNFTPSSLIISFEIQISWLMDQKLVTFSWLYTIFTFTVNVL
jgi:hypothetical protein